jgi:hypothetical protein
MQSIGQCLDFVSFSIACQWMSTLWGLDQNLLPSVQCQRTTLDMQHDIPQRMPVQSRNPTQFTYDQG